MSGKANIGGVEGDPAQEEILRKLEDTSAQRQIDIGGGVMVNAGQEDYGMTHLMSCMKKIFYFFHCVHASHFQMYLTF